MVVTLWIWWSHFDTLQKLLDKHAPLKTKEVTVHTEALWYTEELGMSNKIKGVQKEDDRKQSWLYTGTFTMRKECTLNAWWISKTRLLLQLGDRRNFLYGYAEYSDQKKLFRIVINKKMTIYPTCHCLQDLANEFNNFFLHKVRKIMSGLCNIQQGYENIHPVRLHAQCVNQHGRLEELSSTAEEEVQKIFNWSPCKSCCLDLLPSSVLSQVIGCVLHF